jgi:hydrogenase/urease accessory protein HupE
MMARNQNSSEAKQMIKWSFFFFLGALLAAVFGFSELGLPFQEQSRVIFFVLFGICVVMFFVSMTIFDEGNRQR